MSGVGGSDTSRPASAEAAAGGGLRQNLRYIIPLLIFCAVIFGVTFFAQYTPRSFDTPDPSSGASARPSEPPLRFFSSTRKWDPPTQEEGYRGLYLLAPSAFAARDIEDRSRFNLQDRIYPGYFEFGSRTRTATFWFENRHDKPVLMQLDRVSCRSCSGGRLTTLPPRTVRHWLEWSAAAALPSGPVALFPVGLAGPAAEMGQHLADPSRWQEYRFLEEPHATFRIPAAPANDGWSPLWGVLELQFVVNTIGPREPLQANFLTVVEGSQQFGTNTFSIHFEGANAFEVTPPLLQVGELSENSQVRAVLIAYSSTRGGPLGGEDQRFDPPTVDVRLPRGLPGQPGPFVTVGPPQPLSPDELYAFAQQLMVEQKRPVRVAAAYRYDVLIQPRIGEQRAEIGQLVREIWFALPGAQERMVRVSGSVRGAVWLDGNASQIELGAYSLLRGTPTLSFRLLTEKREMVLQEIEAERQPKWLQVQLQPAPPSGSRGVYELKIRVPGREENPEVEAGRLNGTIVLEIQGPQPQRVRIPVRGEARLGR